MQDRAQPGGDLGQFGAVAHLPTRTLGHREIRGQVGSRQDDDMVPAQPAVGPARVVLDEAAQRAAGFAGLADRFDLDLVAAALLPAVSRYSRRAKPPRP